jgi:hypothetical protein
MRRVVVVVALLVAVVVGCAPADPVDGSRVVTGPADGTAAAEPAPASAEYQLWATDSRQVVYRATANRKEPVGFGSEAGHRVAFAGDTTVLIVDRRPYAWYLPHEKPTPIGPTIEKVAEVVV